MLSYLRISRIDRETSPEQAVIDGDCGKSWKRYASIVTAVLLPESHVYAFNDAEKDEEDGTKSMLICFVCLHRLN